MRFVARASRRAVSTFYNHHPKLQRRPLKKRL
jgi:hypothetical protein